MDVPYTQSCRRWQIFVRLAVGSMNLEDAIKAHSAILCISSRYLATSDGSSMGLVPIIVAPVTMVLVLTQEQEVETGEEDTVWFYRFIFLQSNSIWSVQRIFAAIVNQLPLRIPWSLGWLALFKEARNKSPSSERKVLFLAGGRESLVRKLWSISRKDTRGTRLALNRASFFTNKFIVTSESFLTSPLNEVVSGIVHELFFVMLLTCIPHHDYEFRRVFG